MEPSPQPRPLGKRLRQAFADVATHQAFVTGVGNVIYAASQPHTNFREQAMQTVPALVTLALVAGTAFNASMKGKDMSDPYLVMGLSNILTAGVLIHNGFADHALHPEKSMRHMLFANTALGGWGFGHLFSALKIKTRREPSNLAVTNLTWYGAADVTVALATPPSPLQAIPIGIAGVGLLKTFMGGKFLSKIFSDRARKPPPAEGSLRWHATPCRIYGVGYVVNGALSLVADPIFAAVNAIWAAGYWCMDKKENKALRQSIVKAVTRKPSSPLPK